MDTSEINVGIDTSSKQLDIYVRPSGQFFSVNNDNLGIKEAVKAITKTQTCAGIDRINWTARTCICLCSS